MTEKKKLQVFISSTYTDLREERQAAVEAVFTSGHIPAGMELFAAGDESQMNVIMRWIDQSDVFMLILGGRYGSIEPKTQKSYVQLEYEYAVKKGKPLFAVVVNESYLEKKVKKYGSAVIEKDYPDKLKQFRELVCSRMVRFWSDPKDIKLSVMETIADFSKRADVIGWIPGAKGVVTEAVEQIENLTNGKAQLGITICANDEDNIEYLSKFIEKNSITKAKMIQYSGDMVRSIISKLLAKNVKVEILLQHPQNALNPDQLVKMANFHERVRTDFKNPKNLTIKYYTEPASVRAIKLDDKILLMGWYTYHIKSHSETKPWLYGHNNATVRVQPISRARDLTITFDGVFQSLWDNAISNIEIDKEIENAQRNLGAHRKPKH